MKHKLIACALLAAGCVAAAQQSPPSTSSLSAQEKRSAEKIRTLETKIDRLETELVKQQEKLVALKVDVSAKVRDVSSSVPVKPAIILNINGGIVIINAGRPGFRAGDTVLVMRHAATGWQILGKLLIDRVYAEDSEAEITENVGLQPEDEVYVAGRISSPYSIARLKTDSKP